MRFWEWLFGSIKQFPPAEVGPVARAPEPAPAPPPPPEPPPPPPAPQFGIEQAMALMRALPLDEDPDLVLKVVRKTLRSTGISVEELVASTRKREIDLSDGITSDHDAIAQLERDIVARRAHIEELVAQREEAESLRKRLQEAIENESKVGMIMPPEEMMRLQAEAAAASTPEPPPKSALPKPTPPKVSVAPPLKKSTVPKPPPALPSRSVKPPPTTTPSSGVASSKEPISLDAVALEPDEGPPSEPTVKVAVDVMKEKSAEPEK
jgi:hypothetical protein